MDSVEELIERHPGAWVNSAQSKGVPYNDGENSPVIFKSEKPMTVHKEARADSSDSRESQTARVSPIPDPFVEKDPVT